MSKPVVLRKGKRRDVIRFIKREVDKIVERMSRMKQIDVINFEQYFLLQAEAVFYKASIVYTKRWGLENYVNFINGIINTMPKLPTPVDAIKALVSAADAMATLSYAVKQKRPDVDMECINKAAKSIEGRMELRC
ncbi:MAG: hypothetical protein ACK4SY_06780 [Pyrobaculum sp.]